MTNITRRRARVFALCAVMAGGAAAQDLPLPESAERGFATVQDPGAYALPTGPFADGALPVRRAEGRVSVEAWQIPGAERTPFQLAAPIRDTLRASGFEILLDCPARACGGFDFRFATLVLPPPEMFVSLTAYHFVSALAPDGRAVSVLASRDSAMSYVQIIRVGGEAQTTPGTAPLAPRPLGTPGDIPGQLEQQGFAVLSDVVFAFGSSELETEEIASLDAIADWLALNPNRKVLIVGHTDATGSLDANRAVSLSRAQSAVRYLRERHGTNPAQIAAEGAGYMAPVASNLTPEGREANRRVEAVLLSTE
ncbi:OmpA family protein [Ponticoccus alexandrii]|uniref:OmpA family protein n=1 Tax=Ponticoccus alexandrii TaxID=1943633 RepID=A0ABX7F4K7_9RHOB|nr:OmpA family protein [Ponticoccus alexandrii]QRF65463.1 OmpA family protein [Ponticoccus alexandrii]